MHKLDYVAGQCRIIESLQGTMSKRSCRQSSLLSLGIKGYVVEEMKARMGELSLPVNNPLIMIRNSDQVETNTVDAIMECSSDCCTPDREGPNQTKSSQVHRPGSYKVCAVLSSSVCTSTVVQPTSLAHS